MLMVVEPADPNVIGTPPGPLPGVMVIVDGTEATELFALLAPMEID